MLSNRVVVGQQRRIKDSNSALDSSGAGSGPHAYRILHMLKVNVTSRTGRERQTALIVASYGAF